MLRPQRVGTFQVSNRFLCESSVVKTANLTFWLGGWAVRLGSAEWGAPGPVWKQALEALGYNASLVAKVGRVERGRKKKRDGKTWRKREKGGENNPVYIAFLTRL